MPFISSVGLVIGVTIGLFIGLFTQSSLRSAQVFLWAIAGSCLGANLGATSGILLVSRLLPPGGEAFSGLVPGMIGYGIGALLGAVIGGLLGTSLLGQNGSQVRNLLSFLIAILLVATVVVQVTHLYRNYAYSVEKAQINHLLKPKKAHLVNTFAPDTTEHGIDHNLAISANDQVLASTGGIDINVWNIPSGQKLRSLPNNGAQITALALSSTGKSLAAGVVSDTVAVYDITTGKQKYVVSNSDPSKHVEIRSIAISPNDQRMVSAGRDSAVRLWDFSTGKLVATLIEPDNNTIIPPFVIFSPNDQTVLAVSPSLVKIWRQSDGKPLRTLGIESSSTSPIVSIAISGNGQTLMIARSGYCSSETEPNLLEFWDLQTGLRKQSINPGCSPIPSTDISRSPISSADISYDGQVVVAKDLNNFTQVWEVSTGELIDAFSDGEPYGTPAVAISPDGRTVFSTGVFNGNIQLWQLGLVEETL